MINKKFYYLITLIIFLFLTLPMMSWAKDDTQTQNSPSSNQPVSGPSSLISANGFSCSDTGNQVSCQGIFNNLDKNLTLTAIGKGSITLQARKGGNTYIYSSFTGCLCNETQKEINCKNAQGKEKKFKGDQMKSESSNFCSGR